MGAMLALCAVAPSFPLAVAAFRAGGGEQRAVHDARRSPPARATRRRWARAQVFVSLAGAKVASASAGTAVAGAAIGLGPGRCSPRVPAHGRGGRRHGARPAARGGSRALVVRAGIEPRETPPAPRRAARNACRRR
jgi:hypothetical protein